jgi:ribosomal protein L30/L7E
VSAIEATLQSLGLHKGTMGAGVAATSAATELIKKSIGESNLTYMRV